MIRLVKREDIRALAHIYKELYDDANIGENWSIEKSEELLLYWYNKQGDLFFVAEENSQPVGAMVAGVKSWFDGMRLVDGELFVSKKYQGKHIGRDLLFEHLKQAKLKYNAKTMEFHTYGDEDGFPQNWYNRIGFKKDNELIIMNGNVEEVLKTLGYVSQTDIQDEYHDVINLGYLEISNMYTKLQSGDKAYMFDMLPEYAFVDNEDERNYLESRITAMKNGAEVHLFLIGEKNRIEGLKSNELFIHTINSCYNKSKIYIVDSEVIKDTCPDEYYQLAKGLYFGKRADGSKESFRDLWTNNDNLGLLIKNKNINDYLERCVDTIVNKINNNEIPCIKKITAK